MSDQNIPVRPSASFRETLVASRSIAVMYGHDSIRSTDLLLGLLRNMPSGVEVVLKEQGVDPDELALVLEQDAVGTTAEKIPHGAMPKPDGILLTGPAEEIVEGSLALSQKLGHMETGSEHIFLSMLQSNDSDAGRKLEEKGLTFTDAEGKIRSLYP